MVLQFAGFFVTSTIGVASFAAAIVIVASLSSRGPNLDAIPTVGSSTWLGSWWASYKFLSNAADVIRQGYDKYKSAPFKVADQCRWTVVVSNREHIEDIRKAPDDVLSFEDATNERVHTKYTLGSEISDDPYHSVVVRSQLTRNIGTLYQEMRDEIVTAFDEGLDLKGNEWKSIVASDVIRQVVCRTSNRLFVGLPLCRNPEWIDLNIQYAIDGFKAGITIALFPNFIRPLAAYFLTSATRSGRACGLKYVGPIIEERLRYLNEQGTEWDGKPNDLISWLMEEAKGSQLTVKALTSRVMVVNYAAIHTASNSFTGALLYLAANPQYIRPLREEVEIVVEGHGWSKESLAKMYKIDSFLRECQRFEGSGVLGLSRMAVKDFTFSDGTFIPKGTLISVATRCLHHDERFYKNAHIFEPFRFADRDDSPKDGENAKCQFASTGTEYLPFGYGKHACPGRFFAANELKSMLAHVVVTYDVKLEGDATRPQSSRFGVSIAANTRASVLFRKRVD